MNCLINEIFVSIQGEGMWVGTASIFVRFAGCSLGCSWCDTDCSVMDSLTVQQVIDRINSLSTVIEHVVITGGEPTEQPEALKALIDGLLEYGGFDIQVETNGIPNDFFTHNVFDLRDEENMWITVSPKIGKDFFVGDELKVVYTGQSLEPYERIEGETFLYLQPCDGMDNVQEVVDIVKERPQWQLSLQTHKLIGIK